MLRRAGLSVYGACSKSRGVATVIDGKAVAQQVLEEVRAGAEALHARTGHRPSLGVVLVGRRRDSVKYVAMKERAARRVGFNLHRHDLAEDEPQETIEAVVSAASSEPTTHGVLVQLPLPRGIDQQAVLMRVDPEKDVDGFHPVNAGLLSRCGEELRRARRCFDASTACNVPCTPLGACARGCGPARANRVPLSAGCVGLLDAAGVELEGRHVVVMGRSNLVGLPMSLMLVHRHATVTVLNSRTPPDTAMALSRTVRPPPLQPARPPQRRALTGRGSPLPGRRRNIGHGQA